MKQKPYFHVLRRIVSIGSSLDKRFNEDYIIYTALRLLEHVIENGIPDDLGYSLISKDKMLFDTIQALHISYTISKLASTAKRMVR